MPGSSYQDQIVASGSMAPANLKAAADAGATNAVVNQVDAGSRVQEMGHSVSHDLQKGADYEDGVGG